MSDRFAWTPRTHAGDASPTVGKIGKGFALLTHKRLPIPVVPELNRRRVMQIAGIGALAATVSLPAAHADPPAAKYLFEDNFDGPAGSAPDFSVWEPAYERETMEDPTFWELPGNVGQYRDDRRNLFLDGKSNLCSVPPRTATPTTAANSSASTGAPSTPPGKPGSR